MTEHEQAIRTMLARYKPADVPGYLRKRQGVIVTHDDVRSVYNAIRKEAGLSPMRGGLEPRAVPADFAAQSHRANADLSKHYGIGLDIIIRWRNEAGLPAPNTNTAPRNRPGKLQPPDDLTSIAPLKTRRQLMDHYQRCGEIIDRWLRETGLRAKRGVMGNSTWTNMGGITKPHDGRDNSRAGMAARFLQRYGPVFRCDARGKPLRDGFFWAYGHIVLTDDEVIERATRKGWAENAWRELAA